MTVSSDLNRISYSGNGSTTVFPVNYYFLEDSHLQVILITAAGVETIQTLTTNYTVSGAGNPAGGSVTMLVAPPTGTTIVIQRDVPATQETDYLANDPFPAESHERALDKLTMLVQQNEREAERALKIPLAAVPTTSTELPLPEGNKLLAWNSNASAVINLDPSDVITVTGQQNSYGDVFTGNGVTTNFTLTRNPGSVFNIDVSINGVTQVPNVDYILNATTLTFTSAPPAVASQVLARYSEVFTLNDADAANVRYLPAGSGAQLTNVQTKLRETVSVKDFGAVGDGVTDDTAAFINAIASGAMRIHVPYTGDEYVITDTVSVPRGVIIYGDTLDQPCILCKTAVGGDIVFFSITGNTQLENLRIHGDSATSGTLVSVTGGVYTFTGNVRLNNVRVYLAKVGLFVNSVFNLRVNGCEFRGCTKGVDASPLTDGGDNGYINTISFFGCYWIGNTDYDFYANPAVRISVLSFQDCTFDPGPTVAKVFLLRANPCLFQNCYFEGGTTVPAIKGSNSTITVETSYFLSTKGVEFDNTQATLVMRQCRVTTTDIINAGFALHTVRIMDMGLPASGNVFPASSVRYFDNAVINGVTYNVRRNAAGYTPVLSGSTTAGTPTYTAQVGRFNVIGNQCFVSGRVSISALGSPTGSMQISLPLPAANIANNISVCTLQTSGLTLTGGRTYFLGRTTPNSDQMTLCQDGTGGTVDLVAGNFSGTDTIFWSIVYEIAL